MIKNLVVSIVIIVTVFIGAHVCADDHPAPFSSRIDQYMGFEGENILPRNVSVWLPASYFSSPTKRFAVLYAHDGQNLFFSEFTYGGISWGLADTLQQLTESGKIKDVIVVGVWNTPNRRLEYFPTGATQYVSNETKERLSHHKSGPPRGDAYMSFIVNTLKPFIDTQYRTLPNRDNTYLLGSSMGGIISLYGAIRYPEVFAGAACLSIHWPLNHFIQASKESTFDELAKAYLTYIDKNLPPANMGLRLYFDYGDKGIDAMYAPYQNEMNALLAARKYKKGAQWAARYFPGGDHNEKSWSERLDVPLTFLLKK